MENASKALLIAAEILIGILILSIAVYIVMTIRSVTDTYQDRMSEQEVTKFNSYFFKYDGRTDILAQEIVSVVQYAQEFNNEKSLGPEINIFVDGVRYTISRNYTSEADKKTKMGNFNRRLIEFIQDNMHTLDASGNLIPKKYSCIIDFNDITEEGLLRTIRFEE